MIQQQLLYKTTLSTAIGYLQQPILCLIGSFEKNLTLLLEYLPQ
jgi:hypothetical protein